MAALFQVWRVVTPVQRLLVTAVVFLVPHVDCTMGCCRLGYGMRVNFVERQCRYPYSG